jgi:3-oxoacyl-[acyl-carrier protein] reductase
VQGPIGHLDRPLTNIPLLADKHAVIFGAAGDVGSAVAREFSAQGATVFLSGRRLASIEQIAADIHSTGGIADAVELDALDEPTVNAYLERVAKEAGSVDIALNLTGPQPQGYGNGSSTLDLPLEQFMLPMTTLVPSQFITARAAARHMVQQRRGVILFVTATPAHGMANVTAIGSAFGAMESLVRCFAADLGPAGVRVVGIRSGAMVDTRTIRWSFEKVAREMSISKEQAVARSVQASLLKRPVTAADTARLAAILASDGARTITGAIVNASNGSVND